VAAGVAREESHLATLKRSHNVGIGRIAKWSLQLDLVRALETGHAVQAAAADNADLRLLQMRS
jgi:hypothetical protein